MQSRTSIKVLLGAVLFVCLNPTLAVEPPDPPVRTGSPVIDRPTLLDWPTDLPLALPDLTEPTGNRAYDLHAGFASCEIVLSTAGNYHMALRDLWYDVYLPALADLDVKNWLYTTSPPISPDQIANKHVSVGNVRSQCVPQVAVGPGKLMNRLRGIDPVGQDLTDGGAPIPIAQN